MTMADGFKGLSLDGLLGKLREALQGFARDMEEVIGENKSVSTDDLRELREHIQQRLDRKEEITDNKKLLETLNLFATDKAVLEIIREDADEWVALLEDIEENVRKTQGSLTPEEKNELDDIGRLSGEIKALVRKG